MARTGRDWSGSLPSGDGDGRRVEATQGARQLPMPEPKPAVATTAESPAACKNIFATNCNIFIPFSVRL